MAHDATLTIHQRLFAVQKAIPYMKKDSDTGVGGKGVSRDRLVLTVRETLLQNGVLVSTSQVGEGTTTTAARTHKGEKGDWTDAFLYTGVYETSFINVDKPDDRHCVRHAGHGKDQSDKATGKASTYAEKLNILKALFLETGIADETRNPGDFDEDGGKTAATSGIPATRLKEIIDGIDTFAGDVAALREHFKIVREWVVEEGGSDSDVAAISEAASSKAGKIKTAAK
jgi:hypothetical protein